jgi:fructose/tagatose bisphosphate aldolase
MTTRAVITTKSKEQRNVIQIFKKTRSFCGTARFVVVVTRASHLTYSEPVSLHFKP